MRNRLSSRGLTLLFVLGALLVALAPARAHAQASVGTWWAGAGVDYVAEPSFRGDSRGVGGALLLSYGLHPAWSLASSFSAAKHFGIDGASNDYASYSLHAGVAYTIDTLQFVPFISLMPGVDFRNGTHFSLRAALGVDLRRFRSVALGAEVAWHATINDGFNLPGYAVFRLRFGYVARPGDL